MCNLYLSIASVRSSVPITSLLHAPPCPHTSEHHPLRYSSSCAAGALWLTSPSPHRALTNRDSLQHLNSEWRTTPAYCHYAHDLYKPVWHGIFPHVLCQGYSTGLKPQIKSPLLKLSTDRSSFILFFLHGEPAGLCQVISSVMLKIWNNNRVTISWEPKSNSGAWQLYFVYLSFHLFPSLHLQNSYDKT